MADTERKVNIIHQFPKVPKPYTNVAIYCRVSTSHVTQEESLEKQIEYYQDMVTSHFNWKLVNVYADVRSGKNVCGREEFMKMINDCVDGKIDLIITKSISRFGRNTIEILENIYKLRHYNVDAFFENENMRISETSKDFLLSVLGGLAQADSESRSQNIKMGIQYQLQSGTSKLYSKPCYGYTHDKVGNLIINEEQANNVKLIFDLYLSGHSILSIIRELQKQGINSPTGKEKWPKRTVEVLLCNEKYIGDVLIGKTFGGDFPDNKRYVNKGEHKQFLASEAHEAIITREIFEKVQEERICRSNINVVNGVVSRKKTHYSMKKITDEK